MSNTNISFHVLKFKLVSCTLLSMQLTRNQTLKDQDHTLPFPLTLPPPSCPLHCPSHLRLHHQLVAPPHTPFQPCPPYTHHHLLTHHNISLVSLLVGNFIVHLPYSPYLIPCFHMSLRSAFLKPNTLQ